MRRCVVGGGFSTIRKSVALLSYGVKRSQNEECDLLTGKLKYIAVIACKPETGSSPSRDSKPKPSATNSICYSLSHSAVCLGLRGFNIGTY